MYNMLLQGILNFFLCESDNFVFFPSYRGINYFMGKVIFLPPKAANMTDWHTCSRCDCYVYEGPIMKSITSCFLQERGTSNADICLQSTMIIQLF